MDKALNMGKSSATGSFQLLIGVVGSTVIMFLGTFILSWLLKREELGLYGVAMIPSSMINFFRDWGVNAAMTKQIASLRVSGNNAEIHDVIVSGIVFEVISGAILSIVCFILANLLASFLKMPEASLLISVMSLSIFAGAILAAAGNIFIGFEKMAINSLTTILQAAVKTAIGPFLVIIGFGVLGAIIGAAVSVLAGGLIGIAIVFFVLFRPLRKEKVGKVKIQKTLKPMLSYGVPLMVSNLVVGVLPLLFTFLMAPIAGTSLMGDYYAASYFPVLLTFFTLPIATALFPTFAKIDSQKEPDLLKTVFASSVKFTSIIVVPLTTAIIALSSPMINTLWLGKFPNAPLFLSFIVVLNLYVLAGNISLGSLMTGLGETRKLMIQSLLSFACSAPLLIVLFVFSGNLSPILGALLGILGIVLSSVPGTVWGLYWVWKHYGVKADFGSSTKILASSIVSAAIAYFVTPLLQMNFNVLGLSLWISTALSLVVGFVIFLILYLILAPFIGAINKVDIDNMKKMFAGSTIVSIILGIPLGFMEKILKIRNTKSK